jgi:hypothetical protein
MKESDPGILIRMIEGIKPIQGYEEALVPSAKECKFNHL